MMATVKIALLLLVVSTTAALENSHEIDSNHELYPYHSLSPSPLPYPTFPSAALAPSVSYPPLSTPDVHQQKQSESPCAIQCAALCTGKKSFRKVICIGKCVAKCVIGPSDSLDDINCVVNCAQSSTNALRYDASLMDDRVSSCYPQCKGT